MEELGCEPGSQGEPTLLYQLPLLPTFQKVLHSDTYRLLMEPEGRARLLFVNWCWRMERGGGQWESQSTSQRRGFLADGGGQGSEAGKTWAPFDLSSPVASGPALWPCPPARTPRPRSCSLWGKWVGNVGGAQRPLCRGQAPLCFTPSAWPSSGLWVLYQLTQPLAGRASHGTEQGVLGLLQQSGVLSFPSQTLEEMTCAFPDYFLRFLL